MDIKETGYEGVEWIRGAQSRDQLRVLVNTVMNVRSRSLLENLIVTQLVIKSSPCVEPECSLSCSQELTNEPSLKLT
jgi:hypothetical protein